MAAFLATGLTAPLLQVLQGPMPPVKDYSLTADDPCNLRLVVALLVHRCTPAIQLLYCHRNVEHDSIAPVAENAWGKLAQYDCCVQHVQTHAQARSAD